MVTWNFEFKKKVTLGETHAISETFRHFLCIFLTIILHLFVNRPFTKSHLDYYAIGRLGIPKKLALPFRIDEEMTLLRKISLVLLDGIPSGASYAFLQSPKKVASVRSGNAVQLYDNHCLMIIPLPETCSHSFQLGVQSIQVSLETTLLACT